MNDYFDAHSVGLRLAKERERLKLSKVGLAEACGVRREMIGRYEKGEATPGAEVLAKLIAMGADVQYILTGVPAGGTPAVPQSAETPATEAELSQREKVLVAKWRMLPAAEQDDIEEIVEKIEQAQALKRKHGKAPRKAG
jgi:transcriptional regulator with XRE-family HTH domain